MQLIAHYCGLGYFPGASIAAARHSMQSGADRIEMDVRFTRDMCPIISHDSNARGHFGVDREIRTMTETEFLALRCREDISYGSHRLSDMLACGIHPLLLHLYEEGEEEMAILRDVLGDVDAVLGVVSAENALRVRRLMPDTKILAFMDAPEDLDAFLQMDVEYIRLWEAWITEERVEKIHAAGKKLWVMACDPMENRCGYTTRKAMRAFREMGADAVLINDIPWAIETLKEK